MPLLGLISPVHPLPVELGMLRAHYGLSRRQITLVTG